MSLFNEYPETAARAPRRCCDAWPEIVDRHGDPPPWRWQVIHEVAHGRVPFTTAQLAAISQDSEMVAEELIELAIERGWVASVVPESYMTDPPDQFIGRLPRKR